MTIPSLLANYFILLTKWLLPACVLSNVSCKAIHFVCLYEYINIQLIPSWLTNKNSINFKKKCLLLFFCCGRWALCAFHRLNTKHHLMKCVSCFSGGRPVWRFRGIRSVSALIHCTVCSDSGSLSLPWTSLVICHHSVTSHWEAALLIQMWENRVIVFSYRNTLVLFTGV